MPLGRDFRPYAARNGVMRASLPMPTAMPYMEQASRGHAHVILTAVVMLALEWELCSEDPIIFCYRMFVEPVRIFLGRFSQPQ